MPIDSATKRLALVAVALLLAACGHESRQVGGVDERFCIPPAYRVDELWWIDADPKVDSLGFSFVGCSFARLDARETCMIPREVIGADVEPRFLNDHVYWRALKGSASLVRLNSPKTATFEYLEDGHVVVASAATSESERYIFARGAHAGTATIGLIDEDALLLRCGRETGISKMKYVCSRYHRGARYSIRYEFNSDERVPLAEMNRLDDSLVRIIDGWQCDR